MSNLKVLAVLFALFLAGCAPDAPASAPVATVSPPSTNPPPPTTAAPANTATPSPQQPTDTPIPTVKETSTPTATLSEWEQAQQKVSSFRNRLDRSSDGYIGLSEALEQSEANTIWCGDLNAAIGDFTID